MKPFERSERVGGQIQKVLSDLLQKKIQDPRLKMVTITGVKMSRDLRIARVYFTTSGGPKSKDKAEKGFNSAIGYAKHSIAQELGLRYTPDLKFSYDESFDYGSHIDKVLKTIKTDDESNNTPFEK
jgi:ribosome-binding factor A